MYDVITMKCVQFEHSTALSTIDTRLISLLEQKIPAEDLRVVQSVFTSSYKSRARSIAHADLLRAVGAVLDSVQEEGARLSYVYSISADAGQFRVSGPGGISGIRMPGDSSCYYFLRTGVGKCDLERHGVNEAGRGYLIDVIDCRDKSRLLTENMGEIKIKKRKIQLTLPELLRELQSKLMKLDCDELSLSYKEMPRRP